MNYQTLSRDPPLSARTPAQGQSHLPQGQSPRWPD